ncbi:MAG: tellurium resistance protein TerC [Nitrospinae bacterium CG11_big_fil_rev_8_21_14_0_20_56_8]|nr:MAG: tellurium resistance protein TerC [Nitrospinae bacterium CG11_big_fil_rev_8_21_14_0_20_56_8]
MEILIWTGFILLVLFLLALDLGILHRDPHPISTGEALSLTALWVSLSLAFNVAVYYMYENHWLGIGVRIGHDLSGKEAALQFLTGYLVEESLSLDNIFVIALIFSSFKVPLRFQHRVLFWGILGALVLRGIMIGSGVWLINRIDWIVYVFGGFLLFTAAKMLVSSEEPLDPDTALSVRLVRRWYPVTAKYHGSKFFVMEHGKRAATPLFVVLALVETSDVMFAVDSIPAIFAITLDPFIVFTSNVFAILGLRSLYFALAAVMDKFRYLKLSLVFLLAFVGIKMVLTHHFHIPILFSLAVILGILAVGVLASMLAPGPPHPHPESSPFPDPEDQAALNEGAVRRIVFLLMGSGAILGGIAVILLPGSPAVAIPGVLALLTCEYVLVRQWANRARRTIAGRGKRPGGGI